MSFNGINVDIGVMKSINSDLKDYNDTITQQLKSVKSSMEHLSGTEVWTSDTSKAIQTRFNELSPKFEAIHNVIEEYTTFLDETIKQYESDEGTMSDSVGSSVGSW